MHQVMNMPKIIVMQTSNARKRKPAKPAGRPEDRPDSAQMRQVARMYYMDGLTRQAISQELDMLPARLGTVFRDEHSLAAHIRGHVKQMSKDFERIKDSEEWGVKIFETAPPATTVPKVRSGK